MSYVDYLKIEQLLSLQKQKSNLQHEELLFIVTHQATELWLKTLLSQIHFLKEYLRTGSYIEVMASIKDSIILWELIINQFSGLKTLSPSEFRQFRSYLQGISGAQSIQYRVLEVTLGLSKSNLFIKNVNSISPELSVHLEGNSLRELAYFFLYKISNIYYQDHYLSVDHVLSDLKNLYLTCKDINFFIDSLVEFDEAYVKWKQEHLNIVKKMIGNKMGTGGYSSSRELAITMETKIFTELWEFKDHL